MISRQQSCHSSKCERSDEQLLRQNADQQRDPNKMKKWKLLSSIFVSALTVPNPKDLVGVLTLIKIRSASWIAFSVSVEKNKFRLRILRTISSSPGCKIVRRRTNQRNELFSTSKIGKASEFHADIRSALTSTTVT